MELLSSTLPMFQRGLFQRFFVPVELLFSSTASAASEAVEQYASYVSAVVCFSRYSLFLKLNNFCMRRQQQFCFVDSCQLLLATTVSAKVACLLSIASSFSMSIRPGCGHQQTL